MIHICIRTERAAGRPWNSPSCMPSMLMRDVEGGETDLQWHWLWVQLCSTLFNWFTKKNHDFGLELAEASIHAQVRKLGIWQIPEAGNTRYHWYEYDMNMIWIWYECDMNMIWIWIWYEFMREPEDWDLSQDLYVFLTVHVVLCVWWCTAKDIEIIEINESENFIMFGPNCSASRA
jgi:hypothetical protein